MNAEVYIFNICIARQTISNGVVLPYPWRIFNTFIPFDTQIYAHTDKKRKSNFPHI
jgi:hypothetical protein